MAVRRRAPNECWVPDITYTRTHEGFLYVATVIGHHGCIHATELGAPFVKAGTAHTVLTAQLRNRYAILGLLEDRQERPYSRWDLRAFTSSCRPSELYRRSSGRRAWLGQKKNLTTYASLLCLLAASPNTFSPLRYQKRQLLSQLGQVTIMKRLLSF